MSPSSDEAEPRAEEATDRDEPTRTRRSSTTRRLGGILTEGVLIIVGALIISTLLRTFVAQMFIIPSGSMENTLQLNDRVLVTKFGDFQRGDVVVFEDPANWLPPVERSDSPVRGALEFIGVLPSTGVEHLIKRVIGMPGDRVTCCSDDGRVTVNGVELDESNYLYSSQGVQVAPATVPFDVVVPADHVFVMGDHRNQSADSRCRLTEISQDGPPGSSAFVPVEKVVGASVAIVAPLDRLATFRLPDTYADVPEPELPAPAEAEIKLARPGC